MFYTLFSVSQANVPSPKESVDVYGSGRIGQMKGRVHGRECGIRVAPITTKSSQKLYVFQDKST